MILIIKIIIGIFFISYIFKIISDLFVAFYKPATELAVKSIQEQGLEHFVKWESIDRFFRHMILIIILGKLLFGIINYEQYVDNNGKEIISISVNETFKTKN